MSEQQEHKITTVEKVKDPRRVAQGKRLAAISREAKAKKKQERLEQQQQEESGSLSCILPVVIVGGVIATVGCYCYSKKKKEEPVDAPKGEEEQRPQSNNINRPSKIENF